MRTSLHIKKQGFIEGPTLSRCFRIDGSLAVQGEDYRLEEEATRDASVQFFLEIDSGIFVISEQGCGSVYYPESPPEFLSVHLARDGQCEKYDLGTMWDGALQWEFKECPSSWPLRHEIWQLIQNSYE